MKRILTLVAMLVLLAGTAAAQKQTRAAYIARYADIAVREMKATGIPASITLAQGCLESGDGNSTLATQANNHFGIKCHGWKGKTVQHTDDAPDECFRSYDSAEASFRDHSDFLRYRDRYATLFNLEPTDYKGWAYGLQKAGYATAQTYAASLIRIIEDYELYRYDQLDESAREALPPTPSEAEFSIKLKQLPGHVYQIPLNRELRTTNGVTYIVALEGDTYAQLAREYNLFKRELLRFNDLKREAPIHAGERVYINAKKNESAPHLDKHVVEAGETLRDLSQRYAVKLKKLYRYNAMDPGTEPEPGTILNLRKPR